MKIRTRRILRIGAVAIFSALLFVGVLGAVGTGAWFSDVETSNGNTFTAGSLDLKVNGGDDNVVLFTVSNMRPGNQPKASWTLANDGTLNGYLDLENITVTNNENGLLEPEIAAGDATPDVGELQDVVNLRLFIDTNGDGWISAGEVVFYNGPAGAVAGHYELDQLITAGGNVKIVALFDWWSTADDNKAMGDDMTLNITFELAQTTGQ
jgi:predicted ribosomally synthesized peptide with SipW-like signal peptide